MNVEYFSGTHEQLPDILGFFHLNLISEDRRCTSPALGKTQKLFRPPPLGGWPACIIQDYDRYDNTLADVICQNLKKLHFVNHPCFCIWVTITLEELTIIVVKGF